MKELRLDKLIAAGNHKLPNTTAIFNLSSATDCPSRKLNLCKAIINGKTICYALKAEKRFPYALPYRKRQAMFWKRTVAKKFSEQFLALNDRKKNKFTALRFNESGDFYSQSSLDKAENIATELKKYNIKCYCYTSRSDLNFSKVRNLIVSGSGFRKDGVKNEFRIIGKHEEIPPGYALCPMSCKKCNRCQKVGMKTVVRKH